MYEDKMTVLNLFLTPRLTQGLFDPDVRARKSGCVLYN